MQQSTNPRASTASPSGDDSRIGTLIAERYRVERLIGRGGMASVYEASDTALPRRVALKIFRPELADDDDMRRHDGEVGMLAALNHPGLVTLYDAVADERGAAVLVLELVEGTDLRVAMDDHELSRRDVALIGAIVADALAYSHDKGIIHRDVKPANILVPRAGKDHTGAPAKLADFGIARLVDEARVTAIGSIIGTAQYLSPEQALGGEVGPPSDVYSLGLVLIEALGGGRPFPGTGVESVAARLASDPELPAGLSPEWAAILRGMTEREPGDRPPAAALGHRLRAVADDATPTSAATVADARLDTDDDELVATAIMPTSALPSVAPTAMTEVLNSHPADDATVAMPHMANPPVTEPSVNRHEPEQERPSRRRNLIVAALVGAIIVTGGATAFSLVFAALSAPTIATDDAPVYPAVDGPIGDNLEQLQRSVAP